VGKKRNRTLRFREERDVVRANTAPCVFCGSQPAVSAEDVVPSWLSRLAPAGVPLIHGAPMFVPPWGELGVVTSDGRDTIKIFDENEFVVLTAICGACNNGWLGRLENAAKAILEPMIMGRPVKLTEKQRAVIAFWTLKTTALLDLTVRPNFRLMPRALVGTLYASRDARTPPPRTEVRLGHIPSAQFAVDVTYTSNLDTRGARWAQHRVAYRIVFIVGELLVEVTGTDLDRPVWVSPRVRDEGRLVKVWPAGAKAIGWPSEQGFSDREAFMCGLAPDVGALIFNVRETDQGTQAALQPVITTRDQARTPYLKLRVGEYPTNQLLGQSPLHKPPENGIAPSLQAALARTSEANNARQQRLGRIPKA
jgi:hypothetical protein